MTLERGQLLHKRYRIVEILGQGGMGSVYRAVDENVGVDVAVKENLFTTDASARQFRLEAVILANLRHPNLPRVTDHFVIGGQGQYLVMDYIEGEDLRRRVDRSGKLTEDEAILLGAAICDALAYLHTRKPPILHRDLKPGNIKITPDGYIFLVDFGLVKVLHGSQATTTGARAMTPGYSPPEQYGTALNDPRTDIYSLGATLYAALTGIIPEDGLARAMDNTKLIPLRKCNPTISRRLAFTIEKAMAIDPADRFQHVDDFKRALLGSKSSQLGLPRGSHDDIRMTLERGMDSMTAVYHAFKRALFGSKSSQLDLPGDPHDEIPTTQEPGTTLEPGALLHQRYRIVKILGMGNMGAVYHAVDENLGLDVAIKENLLRGDTYVRQFRLEAVTLSKLHHPNLPRVSDHFVIDDLGQYLVMDYIEGEDLYQRMERIGNIIEDEAILIGAAICDALTFLHSQTPPTLHRDIKPGNVKITPNSQIYLVDFGLVKLMRGIEATTKGARVMTPGYSPPEQYGLARTDPRTDIYSLGATLYVALSGVIPEDGFARATRNMRLTPLSDRNAMVSSQLASAIEKAMEIDPTDRFQTAEDFRRALLESKTSPIQLKVFICHAREDKSIAEMLYSRLKELGLSPWLDQKNLLPGLDWELEIEKAVKASDAIVICLSRNSVNKEGYVQKEIKFALDSADEKPEGTIYLIPLKLEECEMPHRLQRWQWVDYFEKDGYERLTNSLKYRAVSLRQRRNT
jgi:serine/threonine protein kinase